MPTILVVDDVMTERLNVTSILKKAGHEVLEAENGQIALDMAKAHGPAVVIMDIVMPIMDGFAATKRIRQSPETMHIPIVVVSSKHQESDFARAKMLGAKGYLVKPVTAKVLLAALDGLL